MMPKTRITRMGRTRAASTATAPSSRRARLETRIIGIPPFLHIRYDPGARSVSEMARLGWVDPVDGSCGADQASIRPRSGLGGLDLAVAELLDVDVLEGQ